MSNYIYNLNKYFLTNQIIINYLCILLMYTINFFKFIAINLQM